ncbi:unnamed protein product [Lactuca saligna]|uniref:ADP,ATP carrier protein n=1 Tax=Lactuca saligna TaxID=75948 RepID=A0AA36EF59_LACSI|nr:unnamed protein product [Lactuca saligna]
MQETPSPTFFNVPFNLFIRLCFLHFDLPLPSHTSTDLLHPLSHAWFQITFCWRRWSGELTPASIVSCFSLVLCIKPQFQKIKSMTLPAARTKGKQKTPTPPHRLISSAEGGHHNREPEPHIIIPSAAFAGSIISFILCPGTDSLVPTSRKYSGPLNCAIQTIKPEGVNGLFRGGIGIISGGLSGIVDRKLLIAMMLSAHQRAQEVIQSAADKTCNRTLSVPKHMKRPIYVYYQLDNFYQNHRRSVDVFLNQTNSVFSEVLML